MAKVPQPASSFSGQADDLMKRIQRLLGALTSLIAQPTPLAQQAALEAPRGLASLLEVAHQLRAFMDLSQNEALSPLAETKLDAVSALAEKVQNALDAPISVGILV